MKVSRLIFYVVIGSLVLVIVFLIGWLIICLYMLTCPPKYDDYRMINRDLNDCKIKSKNVILQHSEKDISLVDFYIHGKRRKKISGSISVFEKQDDGESIVLYDVPVNEGPAQFYMVLDHDTLIFWHKHQNLKVTHITQNIIPFFVQVKYMDYGGSLEQNIPNYLCKTDYNKFQ
jgi:hypothetical protein